MNVLSYLLVPVQRIPRYELLLKEYLETMPNDHPDRKNAADALKIVSSVAIHANNTVSDDILTAAVFNCD